MQVRGLRSSVCSAEFAGLELFVSEWFCSLLLSAMYAGLFTFNEGHFFYCEGPPCTCTAFLSVCIWFLVKLSPFSSPIRFRIDFKSLFWVTSIEMCHLQPGFAEGKTSGYR